MRFGICAALLVLAVGVVSADPNLYQDNQKAVLYVGEAAPVIDGQADDWAGLQGTSPRVWTFGGAKAPADPAGFFVLRSDGKNLYILADITDSVANENELPAPLAWRNDSVEIMVGLDTSNHGKYVKTDAQIRLVPVSRTADRTFAASVNDRIVDTERDVKGVTVYTDKGYRIEAKIPFRLLGWKELTPGQAFRAEFQINDGNSGERENMLHWRSKYDVTYYNPSVWGDGVVEALPEGTR